MHDLVKFVILKMTDAIRTKVQPMFLTDI